MNSERKKREQEIERLMQGTNLSPEAEVQFQEELKKTASAILEDETRKIQKSERPERPKRSMKIATAGLWLIVLGVAGFVFSAPQLGAAALVCGIAAILWDTVLKPSSKKPGKRNSSGTPSRRGFT